MLQVIGQRKSINVRKVLWTCAYLGIAFELLDPPSDATQFQRLNPNRLIPVIRDGDFVLWESNSICRYLAHQYGPTILLPAAAPDRAVVEQWMDWQSTELNNAWRYAFTALVRRSPTHTDTAAITASAGNWNRQMSLLSDRLQKTGAFVAGADFTLADIVIGLSINRWRLTPIQHAILPAVADYFERLGTRAGFFDHCNNGVP